MNHLGNKTLDEVRKEGGWQEMDSKSSVAWFGGKTHTQIAAWLPSNVLENSVLEDVDFLVIGWRKADDDEVEVIVDQETGQETITIRRQ